MTETLAFYFIVAAIILMAAIVLLITFFCYRFAINIYQISHADLLHIAIPFPILMSDEAGLLRRKERGGLNISGSESNKSWNTNSQDLEVASC